MARKLDLAVTETLVWRVVETIQRLDFYALSGASGQQSVAASTDSLIYLGLAYTSDLSSYVSFRGDTLSRPRWAAAMATLSWGLDMANFEGIPVDLEGFKKRDKTVLRSALVRDIGQHFKVHCNPSEVGTN